MPSKSAADTFSSEPPGDAPACYIAAITFRTVITISTIVAAA